MTKQALQCADKDPLSGSSIHFLDSVLDLTFDFYERWYDFLSAKVTGVAEAESEIGLNWCFLLAPFKSPEGDPVSKCDALAQKYPAFSVREAKFPFSAKKTPKARIDLNPVGNTCSDRICNRQYKLMLIGDIEIMKGAQILVPILVGLQVVDLLSDLCAGGLYLSTNSCTYKSVRISVGVDRELDNSKFLSVRDVGRNQAEIEKVQRASKVVQCVAEQHGEFLRYGLGAFDPYGSLTGFAIIVDDDYERAMAHVGADLPIEIVDVLSGPRNL